MGRRPGRIIAVAAAALMLVACGGGPDRAARVAVPRCVDLVGRDAVVLRGGCVDLEDRMVVGVDPVWCVDGRQLWQAGTRWIGYGGGPVTEQDEVATVSQVNTCMAVIHSEPQKTRQSCHMARTRSGMTCTMWRIRAPAVRR